ncbi:hypothetical protein J6590_073667 [Homalodisca vitripennis]|nr:hypothetical protein J6590_073667 [Homalodisca vitripennis]
MVPINELVNHPSSAWRKSCSAASGLQRSSSQGSQPTSSASLNSLSLCLCQRPRRNGQICTMGAGTSWVDQD